MKIACLLKRLRRAFPDAQYIEIQTNYGCDSIGRVSVHYELGLKLSNGTLLLHESKNLQEILYVGEQILQMHQEITVKRLKRRQDRKDVLTANQVFRSFALSSPASVVKVV